MSAIFPQVALVSLTVSSVLLPLLIFGKKIHHRYAARTFYFLWLLLAARLILPLPLALPNAPVRVDVPEYVVYTYHGMEPTFPLTEETPEAVFSSAPTDTEILVEAVAGEVAIADSHAAYGAFQLSLWTVLDWTWAVGAAAILLWQCGSYLLARRHVLRRAASASGEAEAVLERLRAELGIRTQVALRRSYRADSPMMMGLFRPVIVLPVQEADPDALEAILRHELCHLRRGDVAYKSLLLLACAVHWFNPLVWLMAREAGRNVELCCDDEVLRDADGPTRKHYGQVLLNTAAPGVSPVFSTRFGGGKRQLRERLSNLFERKRNSAALVCAVVGLALVCGALVVCENGSASAVVEATFAAAAPAAPSAPAPPALPSLTSALPISETVYARFSGFSDHLVQAVEVNYDEATFTVVNYNPETNLLGGDVETRTFSMGDDVWLRRSTVEAGSAAGERGTAERNRALLGFLYWPLLRSTLTPDQADVVKLVLDSKGEVIEMTWLSVPETAAARAVRALADSISYAEGAFAFTLPADYRPVSDWSILVTGRIPDGNGGFMSARYLEDVAWEAGKTYSFTDGFIGSAAAPVSGAKLTISVTCGDVERNVDLLPRMSATVVDLPGMLHEVCPVYADKNMGVTAQYLMYDFEVVKPMDFTVSVVRASGTISFGIQDRDTGKYAYASRNFATESGSFHLEPGRYSVVLSLDNFQGSYDVRGTESGSSPLGADASDTGTAAFALDSQGGTSITQSGSFEAEDGQTLTILAHSTIRGGTVDLFLFSPGGTEQRVTVGGEDMTREVTLSAGTWAYQCTGFFERGAIDMIGTIE